MLQGDASKAERFIRKHFMNIKKNVLCFLKTRQKNKRIYWSQTLTDEYRFICDNKEKYQRKYAAV